MWFSINMGGQSKKALRESQKASPPKDRQTTVHMGLRFGFGNDPSAGSPTETLLRLLLPLNDQVCSSSQHK